MKSLEQAVKDYIAQLNGPPNAWGRCLNSAGDDSGTVLMRIQKEHGQRATRAEIDRQFGKSL